MEIVSGALLSFLLDLLLGDPAWMPHPVVYMGKAIVWAEKRLRQRFPQLLRFLFLRRFLWDRCHQLPGLCRTVGLFKDHPQGFFLLRAAPRRNRRSGP